MATTNWARACQEEKTFGVRAATKEELSVALTEAIGAVPKAEFERLSKAVEAWRLAREPNLVRLLNKQPLARFFLEAIEEALEGGHI